jgi:hypothetical protein
MYTVEEIWWIVERFQGGVAAEKFLHPPPTTTSHTTKKREAEAG